MQNGVGLNYLKNDEHLKNWYSGIICDACTEWL